MSQAVSAPSDSSAPQSAVLRALKMCNEKSAQRTEAVFAAALDGLAADPSKLQVRSDAPLRVQILTAADAAESLKAQHPDWDVAGARLMQVAMLFRSGVDFLAVSERLYESGELGEWYIKVTRAHAKTLQAALRFERTDDLTWFGLKTYKGGVLRKSLVPGDASKNGLDADSKRSETVQFVEHPQHMYMRVAVSVAFRAECKRDGLRVDVDSLDPSDWNPDSAIAIYDRLSRKELSLGSPALRSGGSPRPSSASCFLFSVPDTREGITGAWADCVNATSIGGGIGLYAGRVRCRGSVISSTNARACGLGPFYKVINSVQLYASQPHRRGSIKTYIQWWHKDVLDVLAMFDIHAPAGTSASDTYMGLVVSNLVMRRLEQHYRQQASGDSLPKVTIALFDPVDASDLHDVYGEEFERRYVQYERDATIEKKVIEVEALFSAAARAVESRGFPSLVNRDAMNEHDPVRVGVIQQMNLCTEIMQFAGVDRSGVLHKPVCNLGCVPLPSFVDRDTHEFDWLAFEHAVRDAVVITEKARKGGDYMCKDTMRTNEDMRPVGIGVQGLADALVDMRIPFFRSGDVKSKKRSPSELFVQRLAETMYFAALSQSCAMAKKHGAYARFSESVYKQGKLLCDLYGQAPTATADKLDWAQLRKDVKQFGVYNSYLIAHMPTASTSQMIGFTASFTPLMLANVRDTKDGKFAVHFSRAFEVLREAFASKKELSTKEVDAQALEAYKSVIGSAGKTFGGTAQHLVHLPVEARDLLRTKYEIPNMFVNRLVELWQPWVCQSMSKSLFMPKYSRAAWTACLLDAWRRGLNTLSYYTLMAPVNAINQDGGASARAFAKDASSYKVLSSNGSETQKHARNSAEQTSAEHEERPAKRRRATGADACSRANPDCESCGS